MNSTHKSYRALALGCVLLFMISLFAFISPRAEAFPKHVIQRTKEETKKKNQGKEEKKETKKKKEKKNNDNSSSSSSSSSSKTKYYYEGNYQNRRDKRHKTHYSYYSTTYDRVVDIYFNEAYARLNEGFFYDEEEDFEYLPGEWFDIVLAFDCYAIVPGEDIKIRYNVYTLDDEKLMSGKIFRPIFSGANEKNLFRAIPRSLLDEYGKIYVDITLTIEGNDAYSGFWLETVPMGNEGPLRVGDVVVADPVFGGEADPRSNLIEGNEYKLFVEYKIDQYLGESVVIEWHIYDPEGQDIVTGTGSIQPQPGYGYYVARFTIPELSFTGTQVCLLDVRITASPYLGRRILEINVTGDNPGNSLEIEPIGVIEIEPAAFPIDIKVETFGSEENYFEFDGFNLFLPYRWDVTEQDAGLTMDIGDGITGTLAVNTFFWENAAEIELEDTVNNLEEDVEGVVLTRKSYFVSGKEVLSSLFLEMNNGTVEKADLYAYYIYNRAESSFDFAIINLSNGADGIAELYDALDVILEGLFFTDL